MPPSIQPPIIVRFNASSVPILQISLSQRDDVGRGSLRLRPVHLRTQLSTDPGADDADALRRQERQIMVDLDPQALQAKGISPKEVADAINAYNLAYPTGVARIGTQEYPVTLNNTPADRRGVQQHPDQGRQRRDDLHARRGPGPRRLHDADDRRPPRRQARRAGDASSRTATPRRSTSSTRSRRCCRRSRPRRRQGLDIDLLFDQSLFVTGGRRGRRRTRASSPAC